MEPLVSIVIPVYNGEKYQDSCMEWLLQQTYTNLEIILVDDGSRDHSPAMCDDYAKKDSRIRVCHQTNKGASGTRNTGIENATGKYICFFDVDDTVTSEVISDNVKLAEEQNADVVMFGFWYYDVDQDKLFPDKIEKPFAGDNEEFFYTYLTSTIENEMLNPPWNKLIRRSLIMETGLRFDTRCPIFEDIIFATTLLAVAKRIVVKDRLYYKYYVKSSGSLITGFYENLLEVAKLMHENGINYCNRYLNNALQVRKYDTLFVRHMFTYLKQISCKEDWKKQRKYELLQKIFADETFLKALNNVELSGKKKLVRLLIHHKMYRTCCAFYIILGKLQTK